MFKWGEHSLGGVANVRHRLSCHVTHPKRRAEQFPDTFYVTGDMLFLKSSQHDVEWKRVDTSRDHLWSKAHVKNKEHIILHALSDGQISVKGRTHKSNSMKTS